MPLRLSELLKSRWVLCGLIAAALLLCLGNRSWHHHDEFGYLYGAAHYSPGDLAAGRFEASNITGFYNGKLGHLFILRELARDPSGGVKGIGWIQSVYTALTLAACAFLLLSAAWIFGDRCHAWIVAFFALAAPITIYVAPKLLAEVPALFFGMASVMTFVMALRERGAGLRWAAGALSAACFFCAVMSRATVLLMVAGAWLAIWLFPPEGIRRRTAFSVAALIGFSGLAAALAIDRFGGVPVFLGGNALKTVMHQKIELRELCRRFILAFGPLLVLFPFALILPRARLRQAGFYAVWLLLSGLPFLALPYIEERFLITGLPGIAGLAALGAEAVLDRLSVHGRSLLRALWLAAIVAAALLGNRVLQPKMMRELEADDYAQIVEWAEANQPGRPILVPWTWSDYHYLRLAYPDLPIYLVNDLTFLDGAASTLKSQEAWKAAQAGWYGERYIPDAGAAGKLGPMPWLYLSWSVEGWDTDRFGWVKRDSKLKADLLASRGRYRLYSVAESAELP